MSNVLPIESKKHHDRRLRARFIFVAATVSTAGAIVAMIALVPALLSVKIARAALNAPSQEASATAREDQKKAQRAQALVTALSSVANATSSPSDAIAAALALQPAGISVTNILYESGSQKKILVTGTSARREAVNTFRDELEKSGKFSSVSVPVAALVGTQEGRFTITLIGEF